MSRIHEALKKAELERAAQGNQGAPSLSTEVSEESNGSQHVAAATATEVFAGPAASSQTQLQNGVWQFEQLRARCAQPTWVPNPNVNVFSNPGKTGDAAEQFRTLRSRLYQLRSSQELHTILVTSPVPGDGKTFVASNLAHAIVRQPDRRVLIIDGDLRASRLHMQFGAPRTPGLADYLNGDADELAVLQQGPESGLFLIAGGNAATNPSELLANGRLKLLLDRVGPAFDWVIIDSPPCVPVADARVIADICDGVVLVIRAGSTPLASAQKASQELQGKNVVGVVLNTVEEDAFAYSAYYGSDYDARAVANRSTKVN
jgi:protein-tyrosine kinase